MPATVKHLDIAPVVRYLESHEQPFESSQLYSSATETKFVDESLRLSSFRAIKSEPLFQLCDTLLDEVNKQAGEDFHFTLVRSDATQIKYSAGGFFKRHKDFLSVTSNVVEEYTLLVCITPEKLAAEVAGGGTVIHALGSSTKYSATTTPGEALLFRKDLEHEAELLESGEKHLLSLNLWATRKRTSGQVLLVSFPTVAAEGCGGGEASKPRTRQRVSAESALKHAADAATSYAIAVDDANSSMLQAHVAWNNRTAEEVGQLPSAVVPYECSNCSHTEFGTIFRIMTRMHVSPDELHANRDLVDFYFPNFKTENVLVDLATESMLQLGGNATVIIGGLKGDLAVLNGCRGTVIAAETAEPFKRSDKVRITGLCSRPELNSALGVVLGFDEASGRYAVKLAQAKPGDPSSSVKVKHANLQLAAQPKEVRLRVTRADGSEQDVVLPPCNLLADLEAELAANAKAAAEAACADAEAFDAEVIVCESDERTRVVLEVARKLQLPYAPFKMLFVEGVTQYAPEGDLMPPVQIPVMPAWISVGDYDNIFSYQKLATKGITVESRSLQAIIDDCDVFKPSEWGGGKAGRRPREPLKAEGLWFEDKYKAVQAANPEMNYIEVSALMGRWDAAPEDVKATYEAKAAAALAEHAPKLAEWKANVAAEAQQNAAACLDGNTGKVVDLEQFGVDEYDTLQDGCCMGLRFCLPAVDQTNLIKSIIFDAHVTPSKVKVLPGGDDYGTKPPAAAAQSGEAAPALFHVDSSGKACFSASEAQAASAHIAALRLDERVKACLQRKKFVLPQQSRNVSENFCNEAVYGKLNFLRVSGIVRLDAAGAAATSGELAAFDAWPAPDKKNPKLNFRDFDDGFY